MTRKSQVVSSLLLLSATALAFPACTGDKGEQGASGEQGEPGMEGAQGPSSVGPSGPEGPDGPAGIDGKDGESGQNGNDGTDGNDGIDASVAGAPNLGQGGEPSVELPAHGSLSFAPVSAPTSDADKRQVLASPLVTLNGVSSAIGFTTEARSGQVIGTEVFGRITDQDGNPLKNADESDVVSPSNDFSSLLKVGDKLFEITHFETTPAAMYLSELSQADDGKLAITRTKPLDFSDFKGLWTPCAGTVSPWNTHLGGEEYPADARRWETAATLDEVGAGAMIRYFGLDTATATVSQAKAAFNPYAYGYMTEVSVTEAGIPTVTKHYAAGRRAEELPYVMPDRKTVYLTDDGSNDAFFMFVAKTPGNLSEGTLYAARWYQTSPNGAAHGTADIGWIQLGPSATDAQVKALIDGNTKFSDIFDSETPNADGTCPSAGTGFKSNIVDVSYGTKTECLKLKDGMELAASRLESRRYAGYVGATTEFRKNEGISFNPEGSRLYVAWSEINNGVLDNDQTSKRDLGGPNHVRLAQNNCGGVFEFQVSPDSAVGSDYVVNGASSLIEGTWLANPSAANKYPDDSPYGKNASGSAGTDKNVCSINAIANPDNISYLPGYDTLLIGEDSGAEHQNDAVWAFNVVSRELTRIVTTPYGAETTGVYYYPNLNGHAYIKVQVQHPFGESDTDQVPVDSADRQSYVGYVGPLPAMR
jgi:uncharacterized protein